MTVKKSMMSYLSTDEFTEILFNFPLERVVQDYLFEGTPYVFRERPEDLNILYNHLLSKLNFSERNITIVGSAKIGFSLSPDSFPRRFTDQSDIDVLIVNEYLFDRVWTIMLEWNYPRRFRLVNADWQWSKKRRDELYWGWFVPDKIRFEGLSFPSVLKPLREISTSWFNAFRSLSQYPELADRNISGRLYRTWNYALFYHVDSFRQLKESIMY